MGFSVNERVRWVSQAGGRSKEKEGVVVAVVPPGTLPSRADFPELYAGPNGSARKRESYVVRVQTSTLRGSTVSKLYWPRESALSLAEPPAKEGLTLDALIEQLVALKAHSGGQAPVVLAYSAARVRMGASPAMPVTRAAAGFDWNRGKVFLHTRELLAAPTAELEAVRKRFDEMAYALSCARRIVLDVAPADARIEQLKEVLGS